MKLWNSVVGKLWVTIILLVAVVLLTLGGFLLQYIDIAFTNSHDVKVLFVYTCVIGFCLSTLLAFFLSAKITQPLIELKRAAVQISKGQYDTRVEIQSADEIGALAYTFNHMAQELDSLIKDLNHEKDHLASVLRSMTDAVITFDAEGNIILSNPPAQQIFLRWNEIDWSEIDYDHDNGPEVVTQVPPPLLQHYEAVLREGRDISDKIHVQSGVWSIVMAPLKSNSTIRGAVVVMRDVTEENQLEKLRKDFVANVSHELRTPLSMLQGYTEALQDDIVSTPQEREELISVIHEESLRMGRLVHDLLDLAVMESHQMKVLPIQVDLVVVLRRIHRKFQVFAKERGIECIFQFEQERLVIDAGDEDRLEQVFTNLLDNALRHTQAGNRIYLSANITFIDHRPYVQICVQDEGEGIASEDLPFIFERFYKADKARKRGKYGGGTGLGLAIVKNIIESHRGKVFATSTIGKGTTFTIQLPIE